MDAIRYSVDWEGDAMKRKSFGVLVTGFLACAVVGFAVSEAMAISGKECDNGQAGGNCASCVISDGGNIYNCIVNNPGAATGTCVDKNNSQCQSPAICAGKTFGNDPCSCPANGCN